jgi:hypothetical protein
MIASRWIRIVADQDEADGIAFDGKQGSNEGTT